MYNGIQYTQITYLKDQPNDQIAIRGHSITTWTGIGGGCSVESLWESREKG